MGRAVPPRRILVIEHEKDARDLTAALFEETELDVCEHETWSEALSFLEREGGSVAMVFADLDAAGNAARMAEVIARRWPSIRLVLTGDAETRDELPRQASYMPKPWLALELLIAAETAAGLRPRA